MKPIEKRNFYFIQSQYCCVPSVTQQSKRKHVRHPLHLLLYVLCNDLTMINISFIGSKCISHHYINIVWLYHRTTARSAARMYRMYGKWFCLLFSVMFSFFGLRTAHGRFIVALTIVYYSLSVLKNAEVALGDYFESRNREVSRISHCNCNFNCF